MPSLADYEMDLRDLGAASDIQVYDDSDRDAMFRVIVRDGGYLGQDNLDHLQYDYEIQGVEIDNSDLVVYINEDTTRDIHISST